MRVKLVLESSGFNFNQHVAKWLGDSVDNLPILLKIQNGEEVDLPEEVAVGIKNLVSVETGEMVSRKYDLNIPIEEVKNKYKRAMTLNDAKIIMQQPQQPIKFKSVKKIK